MSTNFSAADPVLHYEWFEWSELTRDRLHRILMLRSVVFVVEQNCVFQDIDGRDPLAVHLCVDAETDGMLGCLRVLPPEAGKAGPSIGRVVVVSAARRRGIATELMHLAIQHCQSRYPGEGIRLSAQEHLQDFYATLGFRGASERYLDDGIWHVDMIHSL